MFRPVLLRFKDIADFRPLYKLRNAYLVWVNVVFIDHVSFLYKSFIADLPYICSFTSCFLFSTMTTLLMPLLCGRPLEAALTL